jgi:hypothetical protein
MPPTKCHANLHNENGERRSRDAALSKKNDEALETVEQGGNVTFDATDVFE